jgi:hypothetical protein
MTTDNTLASLKRRLEKAELVHLRNHAGELASRLERAEEESTSAWAAAEMWREDHLQLMQELAADGHAIGLTKEGTVGLMAEIKSSACAIGEQWPGTDAIYAGISLSSDNARAVHLILWPETNTKQLDHAAAIAVAEAVNPEHGSHIPTRIQSVTLYGNLKDCFDKSPWYWTSTKHENGEWAFIQFFNNGYPDLHDLSAECRVRAVSEIPL